MPPPSVLLTTPPEPLKEGTPHDAVNDHGHGDKTVTMEPGTVGQAPKDVSQPLPSADNDGGKEAPGYVDQAKGAAAAVAEKANAVVSAAAGLVSGAAGSEKTEEVVEEKKEDERVDNMDGKQVEDFLREKNGSHPTTSA